MRILFLCVANSARSQMAEAILNHMGGSRFRAWSAGREPRPDGQPHPLALEAHGCRAQCWLCSWWRCSMWEAGCIRTPHHSKPLRM